MVQHGLECVHTDEGWKELRIALLSSSSAPNWVGLKFVNRSEDWMMIKDSFDECKGFKKESSGFERCRLSMRVILERHA